MREAIYSGASQQPIPGLFVGVHSTENELYPGGAWAVASWMRDECAASRFKSYHLLRDADETVRGQRQGLKAWHALRTANNLGHGLAFTARAAWGRERWLRDDAMRMLRGGAVEVAALVRAYDLPLRWATVDELRAARDRGVKVGLTTHADITAAYPEDRGDHTDPGSGFPRDVFLGLVTDALGLTATAQPTSKGTDMPKLIESPKYGVALIGDGFHGAPSPEHRDALVRVYGPIDRVNDREFDLIRSVLTLGPTEADVLAAIDALPARTLEAIRAKLAA